MSAPKITLFPAIDLMDGKCVRLSRGEATARTDYSEDPVGVAQEFVSQGARWIHLVDLDAAFRGTSQNLETVRRIRAAVEIALELGGGIRRAEDVERILDLGINRVVIGTWAAREPQSMRALTERHGEAIAVGIDARDGRVAVRGWTEQTDLHAAEFARILRDQGVKTINATDIATDGMLTGPAEAFLSGIAQAVPQMNIVASGGVRSAQDLRALRALGLSNLTGVIVGRALYTGGLTVAEGLAALA